MSNSALVSYTKISPNRNSPRNHAIDRISIQKALTAFLNTPYRFPLWKDASGAGFFTKKRVRTRITFEPFWSEWRDLNSRPLDPQSSALPTAPHPEMCCSKSAHL